MAVKSTSQCLQTGLARTVLAATMVLLFACGGGEGNVEPRTTTWPSASAARDEVPLPFARVRRLAAAAASLNEPAAMQAERLLNYAEFNFPQYFPDPGATRSEGPWLYRHYQAVGTYVGVHQDGQVYVMGGDFGNQPLRVGAVADYVASPLPVRPSSYANAKEVDVAPRVLPAPGEGRYGAARHWGARAFADFEQSGRYSYFAMTMHSVPEDPDARGKVYIWHMNDDGSYTDISARVFEGDRSACIHASKAVVADFNVDGRPDVFVACIGLDWPPFPGETSYLVLSQPNGRYRLVPVPLEQPAFIHSATAADINADGLPDIVITDNRAFPRTNFSVSVLINQGGGRFQQDLSNFTRLTWTGVWQVELLDVDGDGQLELWMSGWDNWAGNQPSSIYALVGPGRFSDTPKRVLPSLPAGSWDMIYDITVDRGSLYVVRTTERFEGVAIQRVDLTNNASTLVYERANALRDPTGPECAGVALRMIDSVRIWRQRLITDDLCRSPNLALPGGG